MDLRIQKDTITVQKEFLHSTANLVHKVAGVTLDGTKWAAGTIVKAGTAISVGQNSGSGVNTKAEPWVKTPTAKGTAFILAHDTLVNGADVLAGALESGYLKRGKITGVVQADEASFTADSANRFHFRA